MEKINKEALIKTSRDGFFRRLHFNTMAASDLVLESWEDLDETAENGSSGAMEKLNAALEHLKVSKSTKPAKDPFVEMKKKTEPKKTIVTSSKTSDLGSSGDEKADNNKYDGLRHIVIVKGNPIDHDALMHRINGDFGRSVRMEKVDDKCALLVFHNTLNARHCLRSSSKYAPMKLYLIDEPQVEEHVQYCTKHKSDLRPVKSAVRPATNVSVIRQAVSRHLNVRVPVSAEQKTAETQQLRDAKEKKRAIKAMWD
ncbi:unnamed protein product [Bursaphelenchus okinawaensis]|uniref:Uncharacterized protein n=1 Tax=Bursaphelenchus okinawaensis TaxID=465554 RepID=A0A811KPG0_9BILA|nr:unnamed protein product [Bursaphelenchus okinawaensis]CAG9107327.1 unnamed protein product [Bursaphelenchus okinawaensis]